MDQQPQGLPSFALSNSNLNAMQNTSYGHEVDEELIPTAIVIKNIPFAVKKEQLVSLMTELRLPCPMPSTTTSTTASSEVWRLPTSPPPRRRRPSSSR